MRSLGSFAQRILLLFLLALLAAGLTACNESDSDLILLVIFGWADSEGFYNPLEESFNVGALGATLAEETWGEITNSEEAVALDGLDVIEKIEQADQLAEAAMQVGSLTGINQAIDLRPRDWTYREDALAIASRTNAIGYAEEAMQSADALVRDAINRGGECVALRANQLRHRIESLGEQMQDANPDSAGFSLLEATYNDAVNELNTLQQTGTSSFCSQ